MLFLLFLFYPKIFLYLLYPLLFLALLHLLLQPLLLLFLLYSFLQFPYYLLMLLNLSLCLFTLLHNSMCLLLIDQLHYVPMLVLQHIHTLVGQVPSQPTLTTTCYFLELQLLFTGYQVTILSSSLSHVIDVLNLSCNYLLDMFTPAFFLFANFRLGGNGILPDSMSS